jgi:UDP-glucuronate decarboxylase
MMNGPNDLIGPVNVGNPDEFTIRQLAELTIELTGSSSRIVQCALPTDDPTRRRPDITLAKEKLGWEPRVSLREGLAETIKFFQSIDVDAYRAPTPNY